MEQNIQFIIAVAVNNAYIVKIIEQKKLKET